MLSRTRRPPQNQHRPLSKGHDQALACISLSVQRRRMLFSSKQARCCRRTYDMLSYFCLAPFFFSSTRLEGSFFFSACGNSRHTLMRIPKTSCTNHNHPPFEQVRHPLNTIPGMPLLMCCLRRRRGPPSNHRLRNAEPQRWRCVRAYVSACVYVSLSFFVFLQNRQSI